MRKARWNREYANSHKPPLNVMWHYKRERSFEPARSKKVLWVAKDSSAILISRFVTKMIEGRSWRSRNYCWLGSLLSLGCASERMFMWFGLQPAKGQTFASHRFLPWTGGTTYLLYSLLYQKRDFAQYNIEGKGSFLLTFLVSPLFFRKIKQCKIIRINF